MLEFPFTGLRNQNINTRKPEHCDEDKLCCDDVNAIILVEV